MADAIRYGVYPRPSYAMCRARAEVHDLLARQYGLRAGGRFMPHATIKGFFRSTAGDEVLAARIGSALAGRRSFAVHNGGVVPFGEGIALDVHHRTDGSPNEALIAPHEVVLEAVLPLVDPDCDFTPGEAVRGRFRAQLTLAMADIPPMFYDEVLAFLRDGEPIGPGSFVAETIHLWAFGSDDWVERWWEGLRWDLRRSWRLV